MKNLNNFSLKNKKIIILGGCGLIGSSIVDLFSRAGGNIVVIDSKKKKDLSNIKYIKSDISNINKIEKIIVRIEKKKFVPDCLINCTFPKSESWSKTNFKQIKYKHLDENIRIHLNTSVWIAKFVADIMKKKKISGSIIQFSSIYGFLGQDPKIYENTEINESLAYTTIKGGILNSVRSMAAHYGKYNLRINAISPGGVIDKHSKRFVKNYSKKTPLNRMCFPEEIANVALFLASNASSYITGANIIVDGGLSII